MNLRFWFLFALLLSDVCAATAQTAFPAPDPYWAAKWIAPPGVAGSAYGVYHFRKNFSLAAQPASFGIHISADNRYRLFVNGQAVGEGPARSDTYHWYYDTYDLAPYLQAGDNALAVLVWNMGDQMPVAQMSYQTGLIVQGASAAEQLVNTDPSWRAYVDKAYQPLPNDIAKLRTYIVVGCGDRVDGAQYPWGWEQKAYDAGNWPAAQTLWFPAKMRGYGTDGNWMLTPRSIPPMERFPQRFQSVRRASNIEAPEGFLQGAAPLRIAAGQKASILLDQGHLTNAYPELRVSGGKGAVVKLSYAEGLMDGKRQKGHRDSINGRTLIGVEDAFTCDGGKDRLYRPLWFRTWRYLQVDVEAQGEPLVIHSLQSEFTGYPFVEKAAFSSDNPVHARIWEVGWRTARLCAGETYYDCPYYEQLQYTGDTRIQALISLYVSGDDRLARKAIKDFADSRIADGLTQSRYPCNDMQVIPPFSLFWVSMVYDYWRHRQDDAFVRSFFPTIESVLDWHERRLSPKGMNGPLEWWNFTDWAWSWDEAERIGGVPLGAAKGGSAILSLQFAYTLQQAAQLMAHYGQKTRAAHYRAVATRIGQAVYRNCWNAEKNMLADTPDQTVFSQHANIWGVLTDAIPPARQKAVLQRIMDDASITQATFYFKFYLFEALKKTKMGHAFLPQLTPWKTMLDMGLTTFAENPEPVRSDCHAWSASPNYQFLSVVCGINPAEPGFRSVQIEPSPGALHWFKGKMPHPKGEISVQMEEKNGRWTGEVTLPPGLGGVFVKKNGVRIPLGTGKNKVVY